MEGKSQHTSYLFQRLKPVCVNVTKDCSVRHLNEAIGTLKSLQNCDINEPAMLEYVLFPFRITLQKRRVMNEEQDILCFTCLQVIFNKCDPSVIRDEIISWGMNTFSLYFAFGINGKDKLVNDDISEEQKVSIVKFLQSMFININSVTMTTLYQNKYMPVLGHVISILLCMIEMEKNRQLQVASLTCLKTLSGFSFKDTQCTDSAGNCWISFLPGICMTFNRLFTSNNNLGQNIFILSLETFAHIIYIVLNNDLNADLITREVSLEQLLLSKSINIDTPPDAKVLENTDAKNLGVKRSKEWLQTTSSNMCLLLRNILPVIMCHDNAKVRMALLAFIEKLLISCMKTLSSSIMSLLDVLLKHSCDDTEEVKNEAKRILYSTVNIFQNAKISSLKSTLNERLYSELLALPRVMHSSNDDMKLAKLQIIKGYMEFCGESMRESLNTHAFLERFIMSLIYVLELDTDNVNLVEEQTSIFRQAIDVSSETYDSRFYRKSFKYFRNIKIHKLIKEIILLLAKYGNIDILIDYLFEQGRNLLSCKQSFLIVNELILGINCSDVDILNSIVELVLSSYLNDQLMKLPVCNKHILVDDILGSDNLLLTKQDTAIQIDKQIDKQTNTISFETLNSNIQLICILLEGVSNCAEILKTEFNHCLLQSLYPLLEKVGSTNAAISYSAIETMNNIVGFSNYKDISDLIFRNSDYLLNSITLQFRRLVYGGNACAVLCVVLQFCDVSLIPIISDVIEDVFSILDEYQEDVALDMLPVLKHFNIAVDKCFNNNCEPVEHKQKTLKNKEEEEKEIIQVCNDNVSVEQFVAEYSKINLQSQGIINKEDYDNIDADEVVADEQIGERKVENEEDIDTDELDEQIDEGKAENEETPFHYKVVITSLEKSVAFIAANQRAVKLKALDVVLHGIDALRYRENDMLPLIHKLWPPIICRLKDQDISLVLRASDILCSMVEYSGNFITKRMTTDFLPYALKFLRDNCDSITKEKFHQTQLSKMLKKLISYVGDVFPILEFSTELFCDIVSTIIPYTNCNIHHSIQETAMSTLKKFYIYRPNIIWLLCQFTLQCDDWTSSHNVFNTVKFAQTNCDVNHYKDNMLIFQELIKDKCKTANSWKKTE